METSKTTIKDEIALAVQNRKSKGLKIPHLAAITVGSDGASMTYVNSKVKSCQKVGFNSTLIDLPEDTLETLEERIHRVEHRIYKETLIKHFSENPISIEEREE